MCKLFDDAKRLVESGELNQFIIPYDGDYAPVHTTTDLLSLTPLGWYLLNLGNQVNDKDSFAMRVANGYLLSTGKYDLPDYDNTYYMRSALQAIKEIKQYGETSILVWIDDTTSGMQIQGALHQCPVSLLTSMGKPMSAEQAFYAAPPDTYTSVYDQFKRYVKPSKQQSMGKKLTRKMVKELLLPLFYGAGIGRVKTLLDNDEMLLKAFIQALNHKLPVLQEHKEFFMEFDYSGINTLEYTDMIGRKVYLDRTKQVGYDINTSMGEVLIHANEPLEEGDEYYDSMLSILAHYIHNLDSCLVAEMAKYFWLTKDTFMHCHDSFSSTGNNINTIRMINRDTKMRILKSDLLNDFTKEVFNTKTVKNTINQNVCEQIINGSHLFCS